MNDSKRSIVPDQTNDSTELFDDDELLELIQEGEKDIAAGRLISMEEVKRRLGYPDDTLTNSKTKNES